MDRLGLPQLLLILAAVVFIVGIRRLSSHSTDTWQALVVWFVLLVSGLSVWLLAAFVM